MPKPVPNFFLIGAQKAGTTAVSEALSRHPEIFMADPKEPSYFVYQGGNPYEWTACEKDSLAWYLGLYRDAQGRKALGDASPYYLSCHHCAEQIRQFNPDARIVAILRNPVYRAFSMYRYWHMNSTRPISPDDFVDCFQGEKLRLSREQNTKHRIGWLRGTGYYGQHLKRYFDVFPRAQIKVLFYDELVRDPTSFYGRIFDHLGVRRDDRFAAANTETNVTVERRFKAAFHVLNRGYRGPILDGLKKSAIGPALRSLRDMANRLNVKPESQWMTFPSERYQELIAAYHDDIGVLESLLDVDLAGWRDGSML